MQKAPCPTTYEDSQDILLFLDASYIDMSNDTILTLRICGKGFAKLVAGQVHSKYRPAKPYWQKRLFDTNGQPKPFSAVHIKNGYHAASPLAICQLRGISEDTEEHEGQLCYRIDLGPVVEIRNYPVP